MDDYKVYDDIIAGKPIAITELDGRGKGVVATSAIEAQTEIWREEPIVCIQHLYSRECVRVCDQCLRFVTMETDADRVPSVPSAVDCGRICTAVFCSTQCQSKAHMTWHALLCANRYLDNEGSDNGGNTNGGSTSSTGASGDGDADGSDIRHDNPIAYFYQFAQGTNDLLLLVARLIATIITAEEYSQGRGQALIQRLALVHSAPWWVVATRDPDMSEDEKAELEDIFRTLTAECLVFFRTIFGDRALVHELLTEEYVGNMVGAFELNNADVIVEPPTDLMQTLQRAQLQSLHRNQSPIQSDNAASNNESDSEADDTDVDASDDEEDFICRGNALYRLQSCMNHSCDPNTILTREGSSTIVVKAVQPIAVGDELTISYIDESLSHADRQAALREYGFQCTCPRCSQQL